MKSKIDRKKTEKRTKKKVQGVKNTGFFKSFF